MTAAPAFHGWWIVAGAFSVLFVAYGIQYSFGVFFAALRAEFAWSRASLSGAFSLYAFLYCVVGFLAGRLTDRWGPRVVIATGGLVLGGALMSLAAVSSLWQVYLLYGGVAALGMGSAYVPCNSTVAKWFVRRRGLAAGLASAGGSAGTFVLPPVAMLLVATAGWRVAYVVFGAALAILLNLLARLMRRDPESVGQFPDGASGPLPPAAEPRQGWRLATATRTPAFWLLGAAFTATWIPVFIPVVHLVAFSQDLGFSAAVGASAMSLVGAGGLTGRLALGPVSDRVGRKRTVALGMALQTVAFAALAAVNGRASLYAAAFLFGFSYGAVSALFAAMVADFFGRDQTGGLVGLLFAIAGSMGAWGPLGAGAIHDATGRYTLAFILAGALNVVALGLLMLARPPAAPR